MFPSLRAAESGKVVREATINIINKTGLCVEGLDYKEMAKYIRMNLTDQEFTERRLMRVMPTRRYKRGRMPGMTGSEALQKTEEGEEKFIHSNVEPTEEEKTNKFICHFLRNCCKVHVYSSCLYFWRRKLLAE